MIDFHCHLDLYPNPHEIVRRSQEREMYILSVTTTPSAWSGTFALATEVPRIFTALGLHPQIAFERKSEIRLFEHLVSDVQFVGEVGLDGSPEFKRYWNDQVLVFSRILDVCEAVGGRILSIHSRRAAAATIDLLEKRSKVSSPILHWFSGSANELKRAISLGYWFSVGPAMLMSEKGRILVSHMPRNRVLTESDGPFVQVSGRSAFPWDVAGVVNSLASIWKQPIHSVEATLLDNMRSLISISGCRSNPNNGSGTANYA